MSASSTETPSNETSSIDAKNEQISRLQTDLEAERKICKNLRREKSYEVQHVRELEHTKASIALKDLRKKLHDERVRELEQLRDSLKKKFEFDQQKIIRQKEAELTKLRSDLKKFQDELEQTREILKHNKCGLSATSTRGAFDTERQKLLREIEEMRAVRRHLEAEVNRVKEAEKQTTLELQRTREQAKAEVSRIQRDADTEVKRLLEELKTKERVIQRKEKETTDRSEFRVLLEIPDVPLVNLQVKHGADIPASGKSETDAGQCGRDTGQNGTDTCQNETNPGQNCTDTGQNGTDTGQSAKANCIIRPDVTGDDKKRLAELTKQIQELLNSNASLTADKSQLQLKIKEMEKKHRATLEKNKRFLEKNIEVTNINRSLEEKIKKSNEELNKLRSLSEKSRKDQSRLSEQLSSEKADREALAGLKEALDELKQHTEEQDKAVSALKMACSEKDRRIELLLHRRRKQKSNRAAQKTVRFILPAKVHCMANGLKETYFGYDEDDASVDSEMSCTSYLSSSRLSLDTSNDDDEVFDEVTRGDLEQSFQRLMKEHLELEKSYSLLQIRTGQSHIDPQRDNKDTAWLEEKETLNKTIRMLKEKIKSLEGHQSLLTNRICEIQEENEELEFRVLELDEVNEKLREEAADTITLTEQVALTDDGVLQMYAVEKGLLDIHMEALRERLHDLKYLKDGQLDKADKLVLLQARAMLGIADKKLKDLTSNQDLLKERIRKLEAEKAELLSAATGVSTDLILEHEETRKYLEEAQAKIAELESSSAGFKEKEAVFKYTDEHNQRTEQRYKQEIADLQRQLSNTHEGHKYETELWADNQEKIKALEKRVLEQQAEVDIYRERVELLEVEKGHLQCGLTELQCENSKLQLENTQLQDAKTQLVHHNKDLEKDLNKRKGSIADELQDKEVTQNMAQKCAVLESELESCQIRLKASQQTEEALKEKLVSTSRLLQESSSTCTRLEGEMQKLQTDLEQQETHLQSKNEGVLKLRIRIGELTKQVNTLKEEKEKIQNAADEQNSSVKAKISNMENDVSQMITIKEQISSLELEQAQLKEKNEELQTGVGYQTLKAEKLEETLKEQVEINESLKSSLKEREQTLFDTETNFQKQISEQESKLQGLETANQMLKAAANAQKERVTKLTNTITELENEKQTLVENNSRLNEKLDKQQKDAVNEIAQLNGQSKTLIEKVKMLEAKLKETKETEFQTRDKISLIEGEKIRQINDLQDQVDQLEESHSQLSDTIAAMEKAEQELKHQILCMKQTYENQPKTLSTSWGTVTCHDVETLHQSEQQLKIKLDDLTQSESTLRQQVSCMDKKLKDYEKSETDKVKSINMYTSHIGSFEARVQELSNRESKLMEEVSTLKLENQELLQNIQEFSSNQDDNNRNMPKLENLKEHIIQLECQISNLKDQLLEAKLSAADDSQTLSDQINKLEDIIDQQNGRIDELEQSEDKLLHDLQQSEKQNVYLCEKVEALIQGEEKLMEQVEYLEEEREKLMEELDHERNSSIDESKEELKSHLAAKEAELVEKLSEAELTNRKLQERLNQSHNAQSDELRHLHDKVEILVDTEERLVDRLGQQEEVEQNLREQLDQHKQTTEALQLQCKQLQEELHTTRQNNNTVSKAEASKNNIMKELEDKNKALIVRLNELENFEMMAKKKVIALEEAANQQTRTNKLLTEELSQLHSAVTKYKETVAELERNDLTLRTKLSALETQKQDLLDTIQKSTSRSQRDSDAESEAKFSPCMTSKPDNVSSNPQSGDPFTSIEKDELENMPREQMISRIHELEQMEQFHIVKIKELSENLSTFRQAVEVVAVTMETDSDIPKLSYKPKLRNEEFEARVQELIKSEVLLKLHTLELEKREAILKTQLHEAEMMLRQQTCEYRAEIEDLEAELDHTRKNEAKLKNKLQYGGWGNETQSLAKIQHLEDLVFELETSERKLRRQLQQAQDCEQDHKEKLARIEQVTLTQPLFKFKTMEDQDKFYDLLTQVRILEGSENDLKIKLAQLNDDSTPNLKRRIEMLEHSEAGLKRKLNELNIEAADTNYEEDPVPGMLDSPEAILRQRIRELERMERHLKQQVVELERDREELHKISRKDKAIVHDLNVKISQLELSEKNVKEALSKMEVSENNLHLKVDEMSDRIEDQEDIMKQLQATEKHLRAQLQRSEYKETTLTTQLEHAKEDILKAEQKNLRKFTELDMEKEQFVQKISELSERISDFEALELTMKQKVRNMENSELTLKDKMTELEVTSDVNSKRVRELENLNETLSQKIHKLEEEKSSLVFELSDVETLRSQHAESVSKLNAEINALNGTLKDCDAKKQSLQKRLAEMTERDAESGKKLDAYERDMRDMKDHLAKLQDLTKQLRQDMRDDEEVAALKKEISKLSNVLQAHEMLKKNHEDAKKQLEDLKKQTASGRGKVTLSTSSKSTQVLLVDTYTLRNVSPAPSDESEFKNALKNLGARHPSAYQEFVRALHPTEDRRPTVLRTGGVNSDSPTAPHSSLHPHSSTPRHMGTVMEDSGISEDPIITNGQHDQYTEPDNSNEADKTSARDNLIKVLSTTDVEYDSPDISTPDSMGGQQTDVATNQKASGPRKQQAIGDLVHILSPETNGVCATPGEQAYWHQVEQNDSTKHEEPYWAEVEGGNVDDIALSVDVWGMTTDESGSEASNIGRPNMYIHSTSSLDSYGSLPPLPLTLPPSGIQSSGSLYLQSEDSADEASEIMDEEDGGMPLHSPGLRAKSVDRDSKLPDIAPSLTIKEHGRRIPGSLDSITDSGISSLRQDRMSDMMKAKIRQLEKKLQESEAACNQYQDRLNSLKQLEKFHSDLQSSYNQLQLDHKTLQSQHDKLKQDLQTHQCISLDTSSYEATIADLRTKINNAHRIDLEKQCLENKIKLIEEELRKESKRNSELTRECATMRHQLEDLQQQISSYTNMESDYKILKSQWDEAAEIKFKALTMLTPLRVKVISFAKKCKTKDELIERLMADVRSSGGKSSSLKEAEHMITYAASEDYYRPISPMTAQNIQSLENELKNMHTPVLRSSPSERPSKIPRLIPFSATADCDSSASSPSDDNIINGHDNLASLQQSAGHDRLDFFPHSHGRPPAEIHNTTSQLSPQPATHCSNDRQQPQLSGQVFIAIKDYDPKNFSNSGEQNRELPLKEGDIVTITGEADKQGYCEGQVQGRVGLVPALYLQPHTASFIQSKSSQGHSSPEYSVQRQPTVPSHSSAAVSHSRLSNSGLIHPAYVHSASMPAPVSPQSPTAHVTHPAYHLNVCLPKRTKGHAAPDPPSNFCVQRQVGSNSILLSWSPPAMDELARSNNTVVKGYKIYMSQRDRQYVPSPHLTKALIEKISLRESPLVFSIQTVGESGLASSFVETMYSNHQGTDWPQDGDVSSTTLSEETNRRMFLAVYDYRPSEHSPNPRLSQEVAFKAGDIIVTYGSVRDDGFYHGKVHGKKGLIPASFLEEIACLRSHGKQISSKTSMSSGLRSQADSGSSSYLYSAHGWSRPSSTESFKSASSQASTNKQLTLI